jgi:hypothetical protein
LHGNVFWEIQKEDSLERLWENPERLLLEILIP